MARKLFLALLVIALFMGTAFAQTTGLSQTMDLKSGFNFVSFTVKPNFSAADFKNRNAAIQEVYSFSATSGSFLSVSEGTLINLAAGKGYIVKTSAQTVLNITGDAIQSVGTLNLKAGFNLIGISKTLTGSKFSDLIRSYSVVRALYRYSSASGSFIQVMKGASGLADLLDGIDPAFTAGQAYFMNVETDTTLNYDNGSMEMSGGTSSTVIPAITGLSYDAASNKLRWEPVISANAGTLMYQYSVKIDGISYSSGSFNELAIPAAVLAGRHTAQVAAMLSTPVTQFGPWAPEPAYSFTTGGSPASLRAPVITYDGATKLLSWEPVPPPATGSVVEYKILVDGIEKMMWAQTSLNLGTTNIVSDFSVNHTLSVKAVVYSLDLTSEASNVVNTLSTTALPVITGLRYDAAANKLTWIKPEGTRYFYYTVKIDNGSTYEAYSMNELMLTNIIPALTAGIHKFQVAAKEMGTTSVSGPWSAELSFTVGSAPAGTLEVTFSPIGGTYPNANLDVNLTARPSTAFVWYTNDGTDPRTSPTVITATIAGYPVRVIVTAGRTNYTIKAVATLNGQFSEVVSNTYSANGAGTTEVSIHMPLIAPMDVSTLSGSDSVTLTLDPADYAIYNTLKIKYTIDGTVPTLSSPEYHTGMPLYVPAGLTLFTIKAIATNGTRISPVSSKTYTITGGTTTLPFPAIEASTIIYDPGTRRLAWQAPNGIPKQFFVTSCTITNNMGGMTENSMIPMGMGYMDVPAGGTWDSATKISVALKIKAADTEAALHSGDPAQILTGPETVKNDIAFGGGTPPALPMITGLGFDTTENKLKWARPSGTAYYYYTVRIDNSTTAEAYSMNELMLSNIMPALTAGTHRFQVAAKEMGMSSTLGPWSAEFSFTIGGTTSGTVANPVTDLTPGNYDGTRSVSLTCTTPASVIKYTVSRIVGTEPSDPKVNGTIFVAANPIPLSANSYLKIRFYAYAAGMQDSPVLEAVYNTAPVVRPAAPTGFVYDAASKKLKWNPITAPAGGTVFYYLSLNSGTFTLVNATEYDMTGRPAGSAELYAKIFESTGVNKDSFPTSVTYPASAPSVK